MGAHTCCSLTSCQCPSLWPRHRAKARPCSRMGASPTWRLTWAQMQSPVPATSCKRCPSPHCSCPWLLWGCRHAGDTQLPLPRLLWPHHLACQGPCGLFCEAHPYFSISSHVSLSRAALARLHAAGFPDILDCNQEPVEISEPVKLGNFNLRLEEADPLQGNEIVLQFLAFGRWDGSSWSCVGRSQRPPGQIPPILFPAWAGDVLAVVPLLLAPAFVLPAYFKVIIQFLKIGSMSHNVMSELINAGFLQKCKWSWQSWHPRGGFGWIRPCFCFFHGWQCAVGR